MKAKIFRFAVIMFFLFIKESRTNKIVKGKYDKVYYEMRSEVMSFEFYNTKFQCFSIQGPTFFDKVIFSDWKIFLLL